MAAKQRCRLHAAVETDRNQPPRARNLQKTVGIALTSTVKRSTFHREDRPRDIPSSHAMSSPTTKFIAVTVRPTGGGRYPPCGNAARSMPPTTPGNDALRDLRKLLPLGFAALLLQAYCDAKVICGIGLAFHFRFYPNRLWFTNLFGGCLGNRW